MTRERCKELLPVMTAFADGAEVQVHRSGDVWLTLPEPTFVDDAVYRVKPKPLEVWVAMAGEPERPVGLAMTYDDAAKVESYLPRRIVRMREVVE